MLGDFVEERRHVPFAWGSNDCVTLNLDLIELITGQRVAEVTWSTLLQAHKALRDYNGLVGFWTKVLDAEPIVGWTMIKRGDIGLITINGEDFSALCLGDRVCGPGEHGLEFYPISRVTQFWKVG